MGVASQKQVFISLNIWRVLICELITDKTAEGSVIAFLFTDERTVSRVLHRAGSLLYSDN